MTFLGPNLRLLPSGDHIVNPQASGDSKPEGGSDAGDSVDGLHLSSECPLPRLHH